VGVKECISGQNVVSSEAKAERMRSKALYRGALVVFAMANS